MFIGLGSLYSLEPTFQTPHYEAHPRRPEEVTILPTYNARRYDWDETACGPKDLVSGWDGRTPAWQYGPAWTLKNRKTHS